MTLDRPTLDAAARVCRAHADEQRVLLHRQRDIGDVAMRRGVAISTADYLEVAIRSLAPPAAEKQSEPGPYCSHCARAFAPDEPQFNVVVDERAGNPLFVRVCRDCYNTKPPAAEAKTSEKPRVLTGIVAPAPDGTSSCVYCGNENIGVEVSSRGFAVRCGYVFCQARGPIRPAQMDAVDEWNRLYGWVHQRNKGDTGSACMGFDSPRMQAVHTSEPVSPPSPASDGGSESDEEIAAKLICARYAKPGDQDTPADTWLRIVRLARSLLGVDALRAERNEANRQRDHWCSLLDRTRDERDALRAEVEKLREDRAAATINTAMLRSQLERISGIAREEGQA